MMGVRAVTTVSSALVSSPRVAALRVENAGHSSALGRHGGQPSPRDSRRRASAGESQFGTESAPLWIDPPLRAAFVAQALGQVLHGGQDTRELARTAYADPRVRLGCVLDKTV
jgi:hypothetical protein